MADEKKAGTHIDLVEEGLRRTDLEYVALSKSMSALAATAMQQKLTEPEFMRLAKNAYIQAELTLLEIQQARDPRPKS